MYSVFIDYIPDELYGFGSLYRPFMYDILPMTFQYNYYNQYNILKYRFSAADIYQDVVEADATVLLGFIQ
jgi:hypothetical protein